MKKSVVLSLTVLSCLFAIQTTKADVIADWTFQSANSTNNIIGAGDTPKATQSGVLADIGTGTASASHASSATAWSIPAGNGSTNSWSANTWAVGDYFQFSVSTAGFQNIQLSYSQVSSSTGPGKFLLEYSTDGTTFTPFGSDYTVPVNGTAPSGWSVIAGTDFTASDFSDNLSTITALNNATTVFFRLAADALVTAGGATVGSFSASGTDRVDNFIISADPVPEPSTIALASMGGIACLVTMRRKR